MINKQGLWFLTLFSLILVLSIYYITMPNDMFTKNPAVKTNDKKDNAGEVIKEDVSVITTLKIELQSEREEKKKELEEKINDQNVESEEKNKAYEELRELNTLRGIEESLEDKIKKNLNLNSFVKTEGSLISVVVEKKEHDVKLANEIMRLIQEEHQEPVSISVKFRI